MKLIVNKCKLLSMSILFLPLFCSALMDHAPAERNFHCFPPFCDFCNSLNASIGARYLEEEARDIESVAQECVWWLLICLKSQIQNIQQTARY